MKRLLVMAVLVVSALGFSTGLTTSPALASGKITVSLSASPGSSAQWLPHHQAVQLCVAGDPSTAYAEITLHHFASTLPSAEPTFTASFYSSGTPRWVIVFSDGTTAFGYPASYVGTNNWEILGNPTYMTYAGLQSAEGSTTVTSVYIVADGSATLPYCTTVSAIVYDGQHLTS